MPDDPITDPAEIARYVEAAFELYSAGTDNLIQIADPLVVVRTSGGAKVMAWLQVADEDLTA